MTAFRCFRPQFWPTVFAVPAFLLLLGLGIWQLERLEWKLGRIEQMQSRLAMTPLTAAQLASLPVEELEYRYVTLTGTYGEPEFHLGPRYYQSQMGYHLMQPFTIENGDTFLVDRGWVPQDLKEAAARPGTEAPEGNVTVTGILRTAQTQRGIGIHNHPEKNFWFWTDPAEMSAYTGVTYRPAWMQLTEPDRGSDAPSPMPNANLELPRNDHLEYAITWFAIAAGLVVIYVLYHRQPTPGSAA